MLRAHRVLTGALAAWLALGFVVAADATELRAKAASVLRLRGGLQRSTTDENPLTSISNKANEALGEAAHQADDKIKKPIMGGISRFRLLMCLGRPNVLEHKKCMDFFEKKCPVKTTTEGTCKKFLQMMHDKCQSGEKKACIQLERMEAIANGEDPDVAEKRMADMHEKEAKSQVDSNDYGTEELATGDAAKPEHEEDYGEDEEEDYKGKDSDGDGVLDKKDAFPNDPKETKDTDGDGTGDNKDPHPTDPTRWGQKEKKKEEKKEETDKKKKEEKDKKKKGGKTGDSDGDGVSDDKDAFPEDPTESKDSDGDGVGDNKESESKDSDGDGVGDNKDAFPKDPSEQKDSDGDGVGDHKDAFPHDPKEQKDTDGDGVGDNSDGSPKDPKKWKKDTDKDGVPDDDEVYPNDPNKTILKGDTIDSDGDGVVDKLDAFPHDPKETKDSDGDGVGDNSDTYPNDPRCSSPGGFNACGGGGGAAGGNATGGGNATDGGNATGAPGPITSLDKKITPLHEDGYNEYTPGKILHEDIKSKTGDWLGERPMTDETETDATLRHCQKTPDTEYCKLYLRKYGR